MDTPTFSELTDKERDWVSAHLEALPLFIEAYSPSDKGQPVSIGVLDRAFAAWLAQDIQDSTLVNGVINTVGIRFGQFLVDGAGFQWVIATQHNHSDLAILALPGRGDALVYPANFVAKRWERRKSNFMAAAFDDIQRQVSALKGRMPGRDAHRWKFW